MNAPLHERIYRMARDHAADAMNRLPRFGTPTERGWVQGEIQRAFERGYEAGLRREADTYRPF